MYTPCDTIWHQFNCKRIVRKISCSVLFVFILRNKPCFQSTWHFTPIVHRFCIIFLKFSLQANKVFLYHTSRDSVRVVGTTFKVYEERQNLTLSQPKTPKPIVAKFEWRDYVVDPYHQKQFGLNPPRGFCSPYRWNIHFSCSKFTTLFWFFNSPTGESVRPISTLNTSNDAVLRKELLF